MRVVLVRHPAAADQGVSDSLLHIPGVENVETISPPLHAVAVLRALQPDLIVMETDGCESDSVSLLTWLRSHHEAPHTILIGRAARGSLQDKLGGSTELSSFEWPRDREAFLTLVARLAAASRTTRA